MHHWKVNLAILVIVMTVSTICMLVVGIDILKDLKVKDAQISVLINEIGELKSEDITTSSRIPSQSTAAYSPVLKTSLGENLERNEQTTTYLLVGQHQKLTDTIMLVVVDHEKKQITLISIPRDFAINGRKINEFYEFFGIKELANQIEKITNLHADKFVIVDMKAFQEFIDTIGGIDVQVEKGIYDYSYPLSKTSYQTFSINKGQHHLDGETALKYARSRHSTSDFDRAKRQQQIIQAVKERLSTGGNFFSILEDLYSNIQSNIETNVSVTDAFSLLSMTSSYTLKTSNVLDTSNYLYSMANKQGQYVLLPKTGNYEEIQDQIQLWIKE